jgi:hypothetical protein
MGPSCGGNKVIEFEDDPLRKVAICGLPAR